jgi:hypothetical protein
VDAFDSDVLIYAAAPGHPLGAKLAPRFPLGPPAHEDQPVGVGSVLLVPELLSGPLRAGAEAEVARLAGLLARLDLRPVDGPTSQLAAALAAAYGLAASDAIHLATAIRAGASRFITNSQRDFPPFISEIAVVYPADL